MAGATMNMSSSQKIQSQGILTSYRAPGTLVTVFFFGGFIAPGSSVVILFGKHYFNHYFNPDQFQSQLTDFAFYGAYYLGALAFFAYGSFVQKDPEGKWGYKSSIIYRLLFSALAYEHPVLLDTCNLLCLSCRIRICGKRYIEKAGNRL